MPTSPEQTETAVDSCRFEERDGADHCDPVGPCHECKHEQQFFLASPCGECWHGHTANRHRDCKPECPAEP
jgi:hypothetical protein